MGNFHTRSVVHTFTLTIMLIVQLLAAAYRGITTILTALNSSAANIRSAIPGFYLYTYDYSGVQNHISDGGRDMFDTGNKVNTTVLVYE